LTDEFGWGRGEPYERYVGRWSRLVAREFVDWLGVEPGLRWLDVGCGTGALSQTALELAEPSGVVGVDPAEGFVAHAAAAIDDPRASFKVGDALSLPFGAGEFDVVVSGLVLNFVPDERRGAAEMARVTRPGGWCGAYVWDYADGMQMMRYFWDAAGELDERACELDEGRRFETGADHLETIFGAAGLTDVESRAIVIPTVFRDFDDYWTPFLSGQSPAPGYVASLIDPGRAALGERLRKVLPTEDDGSIRLKARAWAVRGRRP